ncbi:putative sulfate exporter family transporter [Oceanisphaera pacifica]|uniref:Sulfate exporter family transporter n=1 Tax=Oceanisphaera pacifica TaxID=2818389 RepID=A0ABS3NFN2_9GAMM|nr:putative sulfate exporter family transporter [Oceanisphaera pacifica]
MAVGTVVIFGTMLCLYARFYPLLEMSKAAMGIYTGATIHEVARGGRRRSHGSRCGTNRCKYRLADAKALLL